jgi:ArsR family transcriptional regulator
MRRALTATARRVRDWALDTGPIDAYNTFMEMNIDAEPQVNVYDQQGRFFHILSHPARLQILDILRGGEECVCHIQAVLGKRQAYVSQQLMVLRDAGFVLDRKEGLNVHYRLAEPAVADVLDVVLGTTDQRSCCREAACRRCGSPEPATAESSSRFLSVT